MHQQETLVVFCLKLYNIYNVISEAIKIAFGLYGKPLKKKK